MIHHLLNAEHLFAVSLDILCIASSDGHFKVVNPAFTEILGWTAEELTTRPFIDFVHPEDHEATLREVERQVIAGEKVLHFENRYRHKDGSWRVLSWRSLPQPGGYMFATARDVTEQKTAAERLQSLSSWQRAMLESSQFAIISVQPDGTIASFNRAAERMLGYTAEEMIGRENPGVFHDHDEMVWRAAELTAELGRPIQPGVDVFTAVPRRGVTEEREWTYIRKDGSRFPVMLSVNALRDDSGEISGFFGVAMDITQRKRIQAENEALTENLRLQAAKLEEANRELESFSYSVSHDLRAPLRHIQGYVEMLTWDLDGKLTEETSRYLRTISDAAKEMSQLIDDLLSFSRMGRAEMREGPVEIERLVQEAIRGAELTIKDRSINWKIHPMPVALGDASLLRHVVANLIGNAVKYSRPRETAEIEIGTKGEENGRVVFFVRDNGVGFDMKYVHKLFGVFERLHRAEEFEGTGIGLANVRRVIGRHGGRVWAESAAGEGATFYFTLNRAPAAGS